MRSSRFGRFNPELAVFAILMVPCVIACKRTQLLVYIDTDAPLSGQIEARQDLPADAAIDTLRIDVLRADGHRVDVCEYYSPGVDRWPISLGIAPPADGSQTVRLWIRAFRKSLASQIPQTGLQRFCGETRAAGTPVLLSEPLPELTIDRLVVLPVPADHVIAVRITLALACMNTLPNFNADTTCIDAARPEAPAAAGVSLLPDAEPAPTEAGTSSLAQNASCSQPPQLGYPVRCVPGRFALLGTLDLDGFGDPEVVESYPLRPVVLSPFYMDQTEFSVARLEAVRRRDRWLDADTPVAFDPGHGSYRYCTWGRSGDLPVNCIDYRLAQRACESEGGHLPTEAEWEFAARGRGQGWRYPPGAEAPSCCAAALERHGECPPEDHPDGPQPAVAYGRGRPRCSGQGDETEEHIQNLSGNLSEYTEDDLMPYDKPCWTWRGVRRDPSCHANGATSHGLRGGNWLSSPDYAQSALRRTAYRRISNGFRCVYPGGR